MPRAPAPTPEGPLPDPALVVLVGPSGSGKSTWAQGRYRPVEVVSSDGLRGVVGSGPADLDASADAFAVLDLIVRARVGRGLTTVVDTLGLDGALRRSWLDLARTAGMPAVVVVLHAAPALCRARNALRDRPVPAAVLTAQVRASREVLGLLEGEGWDLVVHADGAAADGATADGITADAPLATAGASPGPASRPGPELVLQLSSFPWRDDPAGWLTQMGRAALEAGFSGVALMDHLIQIPQVGRPWEPIPDPFTVLGLLASAAPGLRLGTLVTPVTYRPAGVLAKTFATLDVLTGGRAFCGIGAGWWSREHAAYGLPFPPARERLDLLERTVETLRALWAPGTGPHTGERAALPETTCYPRPVGPLPVIVGGSGERRTLRIAARWADAVNVRSEPETVVRKTEVLRRHCEELGRDPAEVAVTVLDLPVLGTDREDVAARVERRRGRTPAAVFARRHPAGEVRHHLRRYTALRELGVTTVFVGMPDLRSPDDLAPWATLTEALDRG